MFNYIPIEQSYDYSTYSLGLLIAQIHAISPRITAPIPKEEFQFADPALFDIWFEENLIKQTLDPTIKTFQKVLFKYEKDIRRYYTKLFNLETLCRSQKNNFVITHGDAPGNVLVKSKEDIYLIDWDEVVLAPAERDLWMVDHLLNFMSGYQKIWPDFVINKDMRNFYILKYYFQSMIQYFSEILSKSDQEYRLNQVRNLEENLLTGWILPKLKEIDF